VTRNVRLLNNELLVVGSEVMAVCGSLPGVRAGRPNVKGGAGRRSGSRAGCFCDACGHC
jgi:hypothetical protein